MEYISSFDRKGKRISDLSRARELMRLVGEPHKKLRFIHIAGTNGKGSMAQMFSEILCCSGLKTGLFTSPFLIEYSDRIRINGENIPKKRLCEIVEKIKPAVEKSSLRSDFSQFEITQAIGFCYFFEEGCDVVVLETGLGGLADCTNVIENPLVTVIGSVSYDHTAVLGEALEKIAFQKAGIIKKNRPCVLSCGNDKAVVEVVRSKAEECNSPLIIPDMEQCDILRSDITGSVFSYKGNEYELSMQGRHQISNALTVTEALGLIENDLCVSKKAVLAGLKKARLVGRCEVISKEPLTILDGGHNPDGTKALAEILKDLPKPIAAVIGMHRDKNTAQAVSNLVPVVDSFITVDGFSELDVNREDLALTIQKNGGKAQPCDSIENAIEKAKSLSETTVICGSLYLVSYVHNNILNKDE